MIRIIRYRLSSTREEGKRECAAGPRAGGTLLLPDDDLVVVVAPSGRAAIADEASDDIEAFDLAVLEVAKAEHRARLLLCWLVHGLPFL
jgi:hypothetical protein